MRIGLQIAVDRILWLAGDPGLPESQFTSASELEISGEIVTESLMRLRATARKIIDRGNVSESVSFSTVREFASVAEQELWCLDNVRTQTRSGVLVFEITTGGSTSYRYLPNCVLQPPRRVPMGVSVMISYKASGGMITDVKTLT